mgnify:CR=1 FL=1
MNLLLDTHTLLWWLTDDPTLSRAARSAIADQGNTVYLSPVVVWELRIKQGLGKLELPDEFREVLDAQPFTELPITSAHAHEIAVLPSRHRDPFDRMLVAQARLEKLTLVSRDAFLADYGVDVLEA